MYARTGRAEPESTRGTPRGTPRIRTGGADGGINSARWSILFGGDDGPARLRWQTGPVMTGRKRPHNNQYVGESFVSTMPAVSAARTETRIDLPGMRSTVKADATSVAGAHYLCRDCGAISITGRTAIPGCCGRRNG